MTNIGIVGAGVAGLQLGLYLRQQGIDTTLYAEKSAGELLGGRIPALVARTHMTRDRERQLGVNYWDSAHSVFGRLHVAIPGEQPMGFEGKLEQPMTAVDMRIYGARLLETFAARGGHVVTGPVSADDIERLSEAHDLLVIATGRGGITQFFPRIDELSPFSEPQRAIMTGIFRGVTLTTPTVGSVSFVPGMGELFEFPIYSFEPNVTGLGLESVPGGPLEALAEMSYTDDPQAFNAAFLNMLRELAPHIYARIDVEKFGLTGPLDIVQGRVTPAVRRGYAQLANGKYVLAIGDTHVTNDPITGQGANTASHAAFVIGAAITEAAAFDEAFFQEVEARVWEYAGPIATWSNAMLQPPQPYMIEMMIAATQIQGVADAFCNFFLNTRLAAEVLTSQEKMTEFLASFGWQGMPAPPEAAEVEAEAVPA